MKKKSVILKSDLLHKDKVSRFIKKIEKIKTWMIYAATGENEPNDPGCFEHLKNLNYLQMNLKDLKENLENHEISYQGEKI